VKAGAFRASPRRADYTPPMRSLRFAPPLVMLLALTSALADCACSEPPPDERAACSVEADCTGEEQCVELPDSGRLCTLVCDADAPCPAGQACVDEGGVLSCVELIESRGLGQLCVSDRECASGACVGPDEFDEFFCAALCALDDECPEEEFCFLADHRRVCLRPLFPQISAGAACARGPRECESRACVKVLATDDTGVCVDGCEPDVGCDGARNCVELPGGAHACIEYAVDGESCESALVCEHLRCLTDDDDSQLCTRTCTGDEACLDGWVCIPTQAGDDACMPIREGAGAAGASCASKRDCLSGQCAGFGEFGTLCADPCDADGLCDDGALLCWEITDGDDLCGPVPTAP